MKVILNQDVVGLGEEGDIKDVANGYARNFLLPKKLVVPHTPEYLVMLEHKRVSIEKRKETKRQEASGLKTRLEAEELRLTVPAGENGKLFGSVSNVNVAAELDKRGFQIEKKRIEIPEHTIRTVGIYKVRIRLYDKEEATIKLVVDAAAQPASASSTRTRQPRARQAEAVVEPAPEAPVPAAEPAAGTPAEAQ
jgi:large subunit ribosomal protein L9